MPLSSCAPASANCPDELSTSPILMVCCACAAPNAAPSAAAISSLFIAPPPKSCAILTPDFPGGFHDQLELALLVVGGELVADLARGEAALRRQAQVFKRHVFRSLVDPALQRPPVFQLGFLGRDQPEHDLLPLGQKAQRREIARSCRVVLEKEPVDRGLEHRFGH